MARKEKVTRVIDGDTFMIKVNGKIFAKYNSEKERTVEIEKKINRYVGENKEQAFAVLEKKAAENDWQNNKEIKTKFYHLVERRFE